MQGMKYYYRIYKALCIFTRGSIDGNENTGKKAYRYWQSLSFLMRPSVQNPLFTSILGIVMGSVHLPPWGL